MRSCNTADGYSYMVPSKQVPVSYGFPLHLQKPGCAATLGRHRHSSHLQRTFYEIRTRNSMFELETIDEILFSNRGSARIPSYLLTGQLTVVNYISRLQIAIGGRALESQSSEKSS